jgi:hypothetical protein
MFQLIRKTLRGGEDFFFYIFCSLLFIYLYVLPNINSSLISSPYPTSVEAGLGLPLPVNYSSANLLPAMTNRLFGVTNEQHPAYSYEIFIATIFIFVYILLFFSCFLSRFINYRKISALTFIFLPMNQLLIKPLDIYNIYIFLGIVICFYSLNKNYVFFLVGASFFVLAHPEQSLAAFFAITLLSYVNGFGYIRSRAIGSLAFSIFINVVIQVWYFAYGFRGSRTVEIIFSFPNTFNEHISDLRGSLITIILMYGAVWILVVYILMQYTSGFRDKIVFSLSTILVPFFFWFVTSDGLRSVVSITTLTSLILLNFINSKGALESVPFFRPNS